jgi:ubiquinone/menaquinone biosynthesis C-methylase UbiE
VSEATDDPKRIEREKEFHNKTFAHSVRDDALRFYSVMKPTNEYFEGQLTARAQGRRVLEYGCGPGTHSFRLAVVAERVVGIDISDVAIDQARDRAKAKGVENTEFHVMDAERLTFPDASFDLVCGRAIVHHLDVQRCFSTVARVLKPGGSALFHEPLGYNPLINLYRKMTPKMRTVDEHPLLKRDLTTAREYFERVEMHPFVLTALGAVPFKDTVLFKPLLRTLTALDSLLFRIPLVPLLAWTSVWILQNPKKLPITPSSAQDSRLSS